MVRLPPTMRLSQLLELHDNMRQSQTMRLKEKSQFIVRHILLIVIRRLLFENSQIIMNLRIYISTPLLRCLCPRVFARLPRY